MDPIVLPGEVVAAITTGRVEFIEIYRQQIKNGKTVVEKDTALNLLTYIEECVKVSHEILVIRKVHYKKLKELIENKALVAQKLFQKILDEVVITDGCLDRICDKEA